ncbi:MAG: hypothetical protein ACR2O6_07520, partial [Ilumatobacteraceae bacterium]
MTTTITADLADFADLPGGGRTWRRHGPMPISGAAPNYAVRRVVFAVMVVIAAALLVAAVAVTAVSLAGFGGAPAVASEAQPATAQPAVHVAVAGDILWSIAAEHRGGVDRASYLEELIELNGG